MINNVNITRIKAVYNAFEELQDMVVFVGGATVSLYAERQVFEIRPTDDIDVIVEIVSYAERVSLEEKLLKKGFKQDQESGIICRYQVQGITVDIMPTDDESIGFKNVWYADGFNASVEYEIDNRHTIRMLPAPYFVATKMEAFKSRGSWDGRTSQDIADIIFVLENRSSFWGEVARFSSKLQSYLKEEFVKLNSNPSFFEWVDSHTERAPKRATRRIVDDIQTFIT